MTKKIWPVIRQLILGRARPESPAEGKESDAPSATASLEATTAPAGEGVKSIPLSNEDPGLARLVDECRACREQVDEADARSNDALYKAMEKALETATRSIQHDSDELLVALCRENGITVEAGKPFLAACKLAINPDTKKASKPAAAIEYAREMDITPDKLPAFLAEQGGMSECATKMAALRRDRSSASKSSATEDSDDQESWEDDESDEWGGDESVNHTPMDLDDFEDEDQPEVDVRFSDKALSHLTSVRLGRKPGVLAWINRIDDLTIQIVEAKPMSKSRAIRIWRNLG